VALDLGELSVVNNVDLLHVNLNILPLFALALVDLLLSLLSLGFRVLPPYGNLLVRLNHEVDAHGLESIIHVGVDDLGMDEILLEAVDGQLILDPLVFPWVVLVEDEAREELVVVAYVHLDVQADLAGVLRGPHGDPDPVEHVELPLEHVVVLEAAEHQIGGEDQALSLPDQPRLQPHESLFFVMLERRLRESSVHALVREQVDEIVVAEVSEVEQVDSLVLSLQVFQVGPKVEKGRGLLLVADVVPEKMEPFL